MQVSSPLISQSTLIYSFNRDDKEHVKEVGLRKCFLTGGNSTLRQHCRQHPEEYQERCQKAGIPVNHHAIRPKPGEAQETKSQKTLDSMLVYRQEPFTREGILHAVAQFVACDDQVSTMTDNDG